MGRFWSQISKDEDLAEMYADNQGAPSIPPSIISGALILQYFDDVSDREAAERVRFDLRWKLALGLALDDQGFHYSSFSRFRSRLAEHGLERYAFDKLVRLAIETGLLVKDAEQVLDSTPIHGAAALQDTYTLIRSGVHKLLLAMGEGDRARRRLAKRLKLEKYLSKRKPELDWADSEARKAHLQELVADAKRLLAEAEATSPPEDSEGQAACALLHQLLGQDIEEVVELTEPGDDGHYQIKEGVAKDRIISTVDPQMRHGRKSSSTRFDGYKGHVAVEPTTGLITNVEVRPGNEYDGEAAEGLVSEQAERYALTPKAIIGDHAFRRCGKAATDAERRHTFTQQGIEVVGPVGGHKRSGRFPKSAFQIDLDGGIVSCPAGRTTNKYTSYLDDRGRQWRTFFFPRKVCQACPLRARCTTARVAMSTTKRTGRSIRIHPYEAMLQAARAYQETDEFQERYRGARSTVERTIAHLVRHGFRLARYFGQAKVKLQALWVAAAVNLQRLMALMAHGLPPKPAVQTT
jgi:transposase